MIGAADCGHCQFADVPFGSAGNLRVFCILAGLRRLSSVAGFLAKPIFVNIFTILPIHRAPTNRVRPDNLWDSFQTTLQKARFSPRAQELFCSLCDE